MLKKRCVTKSHDKQNTTEAQSKTFIHMPHKLSKTRRCQLLGISRSSAYHKNLPPSEEDLKLMRLLDELHFQYPYKGSCRLIDNLWDEHGLPVRICPVAVVRWEKLHKFCW